MLCRAHTHACNIRIIDTAWFETKCHLIPSSSPSSFIAGRRVGTLKKRITILYLLAIYRVRHLLKTKYKSPHLAQKNNKLMCDKWRTFTSDELLLLGLFFLLLFATVAKSSIDREFFMPVNFIRSFFFGFWGLSFSVTVADDLLLWWRWSSLSNNTPESHAPTDTSLWTKATPGPSSWVMNSAPYSSSRQAKNKTYTENEIQRFALLSTKGSSTNVVNQKINALIDMINTPYNITKGEGGGYWIYNICESAQTQYFTILVMIYCSNEKQEN